MRRAHTRTARQIVEQRLSVAAVRFLRQVATSELRGRPRDRAGVRPLETRNQAQQRRLSDTVRTDHAEPPLGRNRERDTVQNRRGAVLLRDAVE